MSEISKGDDANAVLNLLEDRARCFGSTHFLATGLPLPNRPLEKLIVRMNWPVDEQAGMPVLMFSPTDPVLQECLTAYRPFVWQTDMPAVPEDGSAASGLVASVARQGRVTLVAIPINHLHPYQGCVLFAGQAMSISDRDLQAYHLLCQAAFSRLEQMDVISDDRPGDLSDRERSVIALTATGRTAAEIARVLDISQRTVHAHLQNASDKLSANNKTHTVVEAIRYGQIEV
ncbi:MAG: LuxR C-terminal-related transcriptional regulator [Pseudomonadota bacterium]